MLICEKISEPKWDKKLRMWRVILSMNDTEFGRYEQEILFQALISYTNWLNEYLSAKSQRSR